MFQTRTIIFAIFSMLISTMDKSEAQTVLNSYASFQASNGFGTPSAFSRSSNDFGTAIGSSTLQSTSNGFDPRLETSQSTSNSFATGTSTTQSTSNSFATGTPTSQLTNNSFATGTSQGFAASKYLQQRPIISGINIPDPSIVLFAHSFLFGLQSMDVLKPYSTFVLHKAHAIYLLLSNYVLLRAKVDYPYLAEVVANSGDEVGSVNSSVFLNTLGVMLAKFFFTKGLLTIYNAFSLSQTALNFIQINAESQGVFDIESMMKSIANGLYDFVNSFKLINRENLSQIYHSFAEVIEDLLTGVAI